jgi:hypothetical protein
MFNLKCFKKDNILKLNYMSLLAYYKLLLDRVIQIKIGDIK